MAEETMSTNFILTAIIEGRLKPQADSCEGQTVHTRFPPGAQRLPAHRPLQGPVHRLRHR